MYLKFFGLQEQPFSLTPNTQFFLNLSTHHAALNMMLVALNNGEGFIKVVGDVGTGKTMLCRKILNCLADDTENNFVTAYIPNPKLTPEGLYLAVAQELGIRVVMEKGQHHILKTITEQLVKCSIVGQRSVLFIDEAQAMPEETIEAVRLLTNLETESAKLLQVVMFGQSELDEMLNKSSLRQLKQRISFSHRLENLDNIGVERYVVHRLSKAGYNGPFPFTKKSLKALFYASRGVPRVINILCHKALMVAYGRGERVVDHRHITRAVDDTEGVKIPFLKRIVLN